MAGKTTLAYVLCPGTAAPDQADLEQMLTDHGVPTREELERLHAQIETLSVKLEGLIQQSDSGQSHP